MNRFVIFAFAGLLPVLSACSDNGDSGKSAPEAEVLVRVDGEAITAADVDRALVRMVGTRAASRADQEARRKALRSLVISRAMARAVEDELSDEQLQSIEQRVADHREQLLVRHYLREKASPNPITREDIRRYYEAHPERFGGGTRKHFEMVHSTRELRPDERDRVLKRLNEAPRYNDWRDWTEDLRGGKDAAPLAVRSGIVESAPLPERLKSALASLEKGETSDVILVDGRPYVARITEVREREPRPLEDVRTEIRKSLIPDQVRGAVDELTGPLLERTDVEYVDTRYAPDGGEEAAEQGE